MKTIKVTPTNAGDRRFFVLLEAPNGRRIMTSVHAAKLTQAQKDLIR